MNMYNLLKNSKFYLMTMFICTLTCIEIVHSSNSSSSSRKRRHTDDLDGSFTLDLQVFQGRKIEEKLTPFDLQKKFSECFKPTKDNSWTISWPALRAEKRENINAWSNVCYFFAEIFPQEEETHICKPFLFPTKLKSHYVGYLFDYDKDKIKVDLLKCHCHIFDKISRSKFIHDFFFIARFSDTEYFKLRLPPNKSKSYRYDLEVEKFFYITAKN